MASRHPELVFLAGPQQGRRATITADPTVMGRVASCDIVITEDFASRQHVRFENSPDGWLMENLSSNGTRVNGRKYKAGTKILLATGDCLGVGLTTKILFVAAGDDADAAVAAYRQDHADTEPAPAETADIQAGAGFPGENSIKAKTSILPAIPGVMAKDNGRQDKTSAFAVPSDAEDAKKKAKYRKYAIGFGVYLAVLLGVVIAIMVMRGTKEAAVVGPPLLSSGEITSALLARPPADHRPTDAQKELSTARNLFPNRASNIGDTYQVVRNYNAYLAHKDGGAVFEESVDDGNFNRASGELIDAVVTQYNTAYAYEKNHDWTQAGNAFYKLLKMIPVDPLGDPGDPVNSRLRKNIYEHLTNINQQKRAK